MIVLAAFAAVLSMLSWFYLYTSHIALHKPSNVMQLIRFPLRFPSVWDVILPATSSSWVPPLLVLLVQVSLTGGFFGTLLRLNTRTSVSVSAFASDSIRSFWRLFGWNLSWYLVSFFIVGVTSLSSAVGAFFALLAVIARFLFLFGDIALVAERQSTVRQALKSAFQALLRGLVPTLPFAVMLLFVTGLGISLSATAGVWGLLGLALLYPIVMTWILHLIVARYLFFSGWTRS